MDPAKPDEQAKADSRPTEPHEEYQAINDTIMLETGHSHHDDSTPVLSTQPSGATLTPPSMSEVPDVHVASTPTSTPALSTQPSGATLMAHPGTGAPTPVLSTQASGATLTPPSVPDAHDVLTTNISINAPAAQPDSLRRTDEHPVIPVAPLWDAKAIAAAMAAAAAARTTAGTTTAAETVAAATTASAAAAPPPAYPLPEKRQIKNPLALNAETKTKVKHFWRIFSFSTKWDKFLIAIAVFTAMVTGVTMPMVIFVFAGIFGSMTKYDQDAAVPTTYQELEDALKNAFMAGIVQSVLYLIYIFAVRLVMGYISFYLFRITSLRIVAAIRLEYMRAVFSQSVSVLDSLPPGQTAAVITVSASILQVGISEKLSNFIQAITLVTASLVISFIYSWKLTLVTSSGVLFILITYSINTPFLVKAWGRVQQSEIRASTAVNEIFSSLRMVAAFSAEDKMMKRYEKWIDESRKRGMKLSPIVAFQQAPAFFAIYATFALTFWYALHLYISGGIDNPQALVIVLFNVIMMTSSIGGITGPLSAAAQAAGAATLFYIGIDVARPKTGVLKAPDVSAKGDIVFSNINFVYPVRPDLKVLDDLSITFPAGKTTAIVGPSGSGKSTIVALLERWYELNGSFDKNPAVAWLRNGTITAGGTQLKDMDLKWWRGQIGLVQQEPVLFNDTILRNVEHGLVGSEWENVSAEEKRTLVEEACREAFAEEYILRLPEGYDTIVGDAGIKLSGGQRQRLAIARAIISKPSILILDEATSAIDVRGEQIVQAALDRAAEGRTTIIIAHRLSTIKKAHSIAVIRSGKLVEQGTHEELMAIEGGVYHVLASAQQLTSGEDEAEKEQKAGDEPTSHAGDEPDVEGSGWDASTAVGQDNEHDEESNKGLIGSFGLLLKEQRHLWRWYLVLLVGALVAGASSPVQAYLFAMLISLFGYMLFPDLLAVLTDFWCLMFAILAIAVGISYFALGWASNTTSFNITHHYRGEYLRNMLAKPVSFFDFETRSIGAMTARLASDPASLQQVLGMNMAFVLISFLSVAGCLAISFAFGWKLAAVTVLTSMPVILGAAFFRVRYQTQLEAANNRVFAESAKFAAESVGAFRTVAALTLEDSICARYEKLLSGHQKEARRKTAVSTLLYALSDSIALLCMALVLWYGGKLLAEREYWPVQYIIIYMAVMQGGIGAGQWLSFAPNIAQAKVAANRIIGLRKFDQLDEDSSSAESHDGDDSDGEKGVQIQFRDVWFRYPTRDVPVLNGLNLTIETGQFVGIVGPSGSGKTTVISLIERFYRPNAGHIVLNSTDIATIPLRRYRASMSLVAQEATLFNGTIRDNILMGIPDPASVTDATLRQACTDAGLDAFLAWLADGLETPLGNRGVALSGGQRQRIAVARALVRDPRLLLLDEATSSLDSETERAVLEGLQRSKGARTMVVVAHRLATVQKADVIFVLGDGKVLEKGDHQSLLKLKGVYYQMCQAQALDS